MDRVELKAKLVMFVQKYKYALLIILIGIILMLIPQNSFKTSNNDETISNSEGSVSLSCQLEEILSAVKGAGRVEVILTEASTERFIYQTNEDRLSDSGRTETKSETVLITGESREQSGLITTVIPPVYLGAVVVCDGADDPAVKLAVVDAVSKATGLGSDKIAVLKMK